MRTIYSLILFFVFLGSGYSQIVNIPDPNLKAILVSGICADTDNDGQFDSSVDTNNDGEIQLSEAQSVYMLVIFPNEIASLEGLQNFTVLKWLSFESNIVTSADITDLIDLEFLSCRFNQLIDLDLSHNINLKELYVDHNELINLNISQNSNIEKLNFSYNQISDIDLSANTSLEIIYCNDNQLDNLDLSQNPNLIELWCYRNQLTDLAINSGGNDNLEVMYAHTNPNLNCITVDNVNDANNRICDYGNETGWCKDANAIYSEECNLSATNFTIKNGFLLFPNPVFNTLYIYNENSYNINSIEVYDVLGNVVLRKNFKFNELDFSSLSQGTLFINIETNKGSFFQKLIKK